MYILNLSKRFLNPGIFNKQLLLEKARTTGIYLLVPIINFVVSVFTSPVFAKYLTAEEFGYFGFYNTTSQFVNILFGLSLQSFYMSVYYRESDEQRKRTLTTIALFALLWNIVFFPLSYLGFYFYLNLSNSQVPFFPLALLSLGAAALSNYKGFIQVNYRLGQKAVSFLLWAAGYRILTTFLSLYLVMVPQLGIEGRMLGILIVEVLFFIVSLYFILRGHPITIDKTILRAAIKTVIPLLPASLLFLPILSYDNIALEKMNEPAEMGLYNIGKGIAIYMYTALFPFFQTFEPNIYKHTVQGNFKALKRIILFLVTIVAFSLIAFWLVSPYVIDFLTAGKYNAALKYSNITAITFSLMVIFAIFDAIIMAWQATKKILQIYAISVVLSITYYTVAGHFFKQTGIAVATVMSYFTLISIQAIFIYLKLRATKRTLTTRDNAFENEKA